MSAIREYVSLVLETAVDPASLPGDVGLVMQGNQWSCQLALVRLDVLPGAERALLGGITMTLEDVWRVNSVWSQHSYGPTLYRLAMQFATSRGSALGPHHGGVTSPAARRVWKRFQAETDVERVPVDGPGIRGIAYRLKGSDFETLSRRYESLGLSPKEDDDLKYDLFGLVRRNAG